MKPILLTLVIAAFLVTTVPTNGADSSWQEPEGFRGLKWGASVDEIRKVFPTAQKTLDLSNRIKSFRVGSQRLGDAVAQIYLGCLDDRFSSVTIIFKSDDFQ